MASSKVIEFYKNHNVKCTLRKFHITYKQLKEICAEFNFVKSQEQIKETYKQTRIDHYGSLQNAYAISVEKKNDTIISKYGSFEFYNQIRDLNSRKTCKKKTGVEYPMQNPATVKKSNERKKGK